jgi:hypothetical protein
MILQKAIQGLILGRTVVSNISVTPIQTPGISRETGDFVIALLKCLGLSMQKQRIGWKFIHLDLWRHYTYEKECVQWTTEGCHFEWS